MQAELIIADIMQTTFFVTSGDTLVADVLHHGTSEQPVVILDGGGRPIGVLSSETLLEFTESRRPVLQYQQHFSLPTLTTSMTPVRRILAGMAVDKFIRWHVVIDGEAITAVVSPTRLFAADPTVEREQLGSPPQNIRVPGGLLGDPLMELGGALCYRCLVEPTHVYNVLDVDRDDHGRPFCNIHETFLIPENPCRGKA